MRVENADDRQEEPECCDQCGYDTDLKRFYAYGPWHQVYWLCPYCSNSHYNSHPEEPFYEDLLKSISCMLNEFEKRISG